MLPFNSIGRYIFGLGKEVWDDLRVAAQATTINGSNPPLKALFKDDGSGGGGASGALAFLSDSAGTLSIGDNGVYDFTSPITIEVWFKPELTTQTFSTILSKQGLFSLRYWGGAAVALSVDNIGFSVSSLTCTIGAWNHLAFTLDPVQNNNSANLFINSNVAASLSGGGTITDNTNPIVLGLATVIGTYDEIASWGKVLSVSELAARYNSGAGAGLVGSETDLTGYWKLDDGTGSTAVDTHSTGNDAIITGTEDTDFEWTTGHVGLATQSSQGVLLDYFSPDTEQEKYFEVQFPHSWKEGSEVRPHIHFTPQGDCGVDQRVKWGLEFTWANVGEVFSDTIVLTSTELFEDEDMVDSKHYICELPPIEVPNKTLSSMMICRVFRDATDAEDDCGQFAGLLELDFHYQKDTAGSFAEYIKFG